MNGSSFSPFKDCKWFFDGSVKIRSIVKMGASMCVMYVFILMKIALPTKFNFDFYILYSNQFANTLIPDGFSTFDGGLIGQNVPLKFFVLPLHLI
jgi:hypothetical protein